MPGETPMTALAERVEMLVGRSRKLAGMADVADQILGRVPLPENAALNSARPDEPGWVARVNGMLDDVELALNRVGRQLERLNEAGG
jgi:hypothetical protein